LFNEINKETDDIETIYINRSDCPSSITIEKNLSFTCPMVKEPFKEYRNEESPSNHISDNQIHVTQEKVCFDMNNAKSYYTANTGSMLPVLNYRSNTIGIKPTRDNIHIGDMIVFHYNKKYPNMLHRVINITKEGNYITRGDNNLNHDLKQTSFEDIKSVVAIIVY